MSFFRIISIISLFLLTNGCQEYVNTQCIQNILTDYKCLNESDITSIKLELQECQRKLNPDLIEDINECELLNGIRKGDRYIELTSTSFEQYIGSHDFTLNHQRDSLIYKLSLDLYIKELYNFQKNDLIPIIQRIASIYKKQGDKTHARTLYEETLENVDINDSLKVVSLEGLISCTWDGTKPLSKDVAIELYPLQKQLTTFYEAQQPIDTQRLMLLYQTLGYMSYTAQYPSFVEECLQAILFAENDKYNKLLLTMMTGLGKGYYQSPYILIGDYYLGNRDYSNAIRYYMEAFPSNANSFESINNDTIFQDICRYKTDWNNIFKSFTGYPQVLLKIAKCYSRLGDDKYQAYLHESFYHAVHCVLTSFDDSDAEFYDGYQFYQLIFDYICNSPDSRIAYNGALFRKGFSNNVDIDIRVRHGNSKIYQEYLGWKKLLAKYPDDVYISNKLKDISFQIFNSTENKFWLRNVLYTYHDIYQVVRKGDDNKTVEFVRISSIYDDCTKYYAFVILPSVTYPIRIELCNSTDLEVVAKIDSSAQIYRKDGYEQKLIDSHYRKGYDLIWSKLEPYINEGDNVYFAPDGLLYQMNIEVLQDANGRRANEKWNLHRVSSTRELCMEKPTVDINSAALYGGLTYEMDSEAMLSQSRAYNQVSDEAIARGFIPDSTKRTGWRPLPATLTEISSIARMCKSRGMTVDTYTAMAGNEESFKVLSGKKTPIIHLATHGFFYKNEEVTQKPFFNAFNFDQMPQKPDNSLKRTGLILAGGQKAWLGEAIPDNVEDGILLAEEIASMDLTGTDLVVLSACETGLGEITSEGVFGLQRAFKKAGVNTLIMSLWQVHDDATSLFMQTFYKHWLDGKSKHKAFTMAQKTMQEHPDYSNPYYWAAFIMLD